MEHKGSELSSIYYQGKEDGVCTLHFEQAVWLSMRILTRCRHPRTEDIMFDHSSQNASQYKVELSKISQNINETRGEYREICKSI